MFGARELASASLDADYAAHPPPAHRHFHFHMRGKDSFVDEQGEFPASRQLLPKQFYLASPSKTARYDARRRRDAQ